MLQKAKGYAMTGILQCWVSSAHMYWYVFYWAQQVCIGRCCKYASVCIGFSLFSMKVHVHVQRDK